MSAHHDPLSVGPVRRWIGTTYLKLTGWRIDTPRPPLVKFVLIAAPHTSNWDLVQLLAMSWHLDLKLSWIGKHTLFRGPLGVLLKFLGGLPIDRSRRQNLVDQIVAQFESHPGLCVTVPPEGTRGRREGWKSGFYYMARGAGVPIVPSALDYRLKTGRIGAPIPSTAPIEEVMVRLSRFYAGVTARYPDEFGPVQLLERPEAERAAG